MGHLKKRRIKEGASHHARRCRNAEEFLAHEIYK